MSENTAHCFWFLVTTTSRPLRVQPSELLLSLLRTAWQHPSEALWSHFAMISTLHSAAFLGLQWESQKVKWTSCYFARANGCHKGICGVPDTLIFQEAPEVRLAV